MEHPSRSESFKEAVNPMSKSGYKVAAEDARATKVGDDESSRTSGGLFVAVSKHPELAVAVEGGKVDPCEENAGA